MRISLSMTWEGTAAHAALPTKLRAPDCEDVADVPAQKLDAGVAEASELNADDCVMAPE